MTEEEEEEGEPPVGDRRHGGGEGVGGASRQYVIWLLVRSALAMLMDSVCQRPGMSTEDGLHGRDL